MRMTISTCLEHLEELDLISDFEKNELTILRLSFFLKVKFSKVEKYLYKKGYPKAITNNTIVDSDWLQEIIVKPF